MSAPVIRGPSALAPSALPPWAVAPSAVVMVRPHRFRPNPQTARDNAFQQEPTASDVLITARARDEFDGAVARLRAVGVTVHVFEDHGDATPDSVFPNNWISIHRDGRAVLYPMTAPNRRAERRADVVEALRRHYGLTSVVDYSGFEQDGRFLEGTGAMVLGEHERVAYVCRSNRAHESVLRRFCDDFGYRPHVFDAVDGEGVPCYHTNVMLCVADRYALVGSGMVRDRRQRATLTRALSAGGRDVIPLTLDQVRAFAGNAIELQGAAGPVLAISSRGAAALTARQRARIERHAALLPIPVPTIELGGGSVRCMIAAVHLPGRSVPELLAAGAVGGRV